MLAQGNPGGFAGSVAGDLSWLVYGYSTGLWSLVFLDSVLLSADLLGVFNSGLAW